jgi:hypothetical protein
MAVVSVYGSQLEHASDSLRADKEVVLAAVENDSWALEYADKSLQKDPDIIKAADWIISDKVKDKE